MAARLPSTTALRCFEAAARRLSFTAAADEVGLTQGAVSYQIRELERLLGVELFVRAIRQISLTREGSEYYDVVRKTIEELSLAANRLRNSEIARHLVISCLPVFATICMMPRLHLFREHNPSVEISVLSSIEPANHSIGLDHVAIRAGILPGYKYPADAPRFETEMTHHWEGVEAKFLGPNILVPIASPKLLAPDDRQIETSDLLRYPLIHISTRKHAWADWLSAQSLSLDALRTPQFEFGHFFQAIAAAKAGKGIALVPDILAAELTRDGDLQSLNAFRIPSAGGYFLLVPERQRSDDAIERLATWIQGLFEARGKKPSEAQLLN